MTRTCRASTALLLLLIAALIGEQAAHANVVSACLKKWFGRAEAKSVEVAKTPSDRPSKVSEAPRKRMSSLSLAPLQPKSVHEPLNKFRAFPCMLSFMAGKKGRPLGVKYGIYLHDLDNGQILIKTPRGTEEKLHVKNYVIEETKGGKWPRNGFLMEVDRPYRVKVKDPQTNKEIEVEGIFQGFDDDGRMRMMQKGDLAFYPVAEDWEFESKPLKGKYEFRAKSPSMIQDLKPRTPSVTGEPTEADYQDPSGIRRTIRP